MGKTLRNYGYLGKMRERGGVYEPRKRRGNSISKIRYAFSGWNVYKQRMRDIEVDKEEFECLRNAM